ncbi:MAG: tetratricopeptide repeat protein, partial [Chitinispirillaceae bacterium]|nr:tetratricopeptide repeat protein [Chitinispirillaceae bacterium]
SWRRFAPVVIAAWCAYMSKPMAVTLPLTLLLLDYWPLGRLRSDKNGRVLKTVLLEKLPFYLGAVTLAIITLLAQKSSGAIVPLEHIGTFARSAHALTGYLAYMRIFLLPLHLSPIYLPPGEINLLYLTAAIILLAGISVTVLFFRRNFPWMAFGWFWFLLTLVPVIGIIQVGSQFIADRYLYIPSIGLSVILFYGLDTVPGKKPAPLIKTAVSAALFAVFLFSGFKQISCWRDNASLFRHALRLDPDNYVAASYLANGYLAENRLDSAAFYTGYILDKKPRFIPALYSASLLEELAGNYNEARSHLEAIILKDPANSRHTLRLAEFLQRRKDYGAAEKLYREFLRSDPDNREYLFKAALLYNEMNLPEKAENYFLKARAKKPFTWNELQRYGEYLYRNGNKERALTQLKNSISLNKKNEKAWYDLGVVYLETGDLASAKRSFAKTLTLDSTHLDAWYNLGLTLQQQNNFSAAETCFRRILGATSHKLEVLNCLAICCARQNRLDEAHGFISAALELAPDDLTTLANKRTLDNAFRGE